MMRNSSGRNAYQQAKEQGQHLVWETVLSLASSIIVREGPDALSMRTLAKAAGCSTTVLYNLFGSKSGILDELISEGFSRLHEAQQSTLSQAGGVTDRIVALCRAYRQTALTYPNHYQIMFGKVSPQEMSEQSRQIAFNAIQPLVLAVREAAASDGLVVPDAEEFAMMLWAVAHGFVMIEIAGMSLAPERADRIYEQAVRRLLGQVRD
jgi:AcrR family transcriptional regulator